MIPVKAYDSSGEYESIYELAIYTFVYKPIILLILCLVLQLLLYRLGLVV